MNLQHCFFLIYMDFWLKVIAFGKKTFYVEFVLPSSHLIFSFRSEDFAGQPLLGTNSESLTKTTV